MAGNAAAFQGPERLPEGSGAGPEQRRGGGRVPRLLHAAQLQPRRGKSHLLHIPFFVTSL